MKKFTIDRTRWYRGQGPDESALRRKQDGCMCCLGLYLEACGVDPEGLTEKKYPSGVTALIPEEAQWLLAKGARPAKVAALKADDPGLADYSATTLLATTNDDRKLSERVRENEVCALFAANGIEVSFTDTPSGSLDR
jgi:hypothetical protein